MSSGNLYHRFERVFEANAGRVAIRAPGVDTVATFDARTLALWRSILGEYDGLIECAGDTVHLDLPAALAHEPN